MFTLLCVVSSLIEFDPSGVTVFFWVRITYNGNDSDKTSKVLNSSFLPCSEG
jgi:hypothetical protein